MKSLTVFIEQLRSKWFPTSDDKAWEQWVNYKRRETRDLIDLLSSDVRDGFKRRAMFLLLVPSSDFNPIFWKEDIGKFYGGVDFLQKLTPELLGYAADLIAEFSAVLKPIHREKPKNVVEGGGGITVYMQVPDRYHDALHFYNNCILSLLVLLPSEQGEKLFPLFSLNDISTFYNMDDTSGYNPFRGLMSMKGVDEKWKWAADEAMRQIIRDELSGKTVPREEWENAFRCYSELVQMQCYGLEYPIELFAGQVQFLMDNRASAALTINSWNVITIFNLLSSDRYQSLRHQIARFVVAEDKGESSKFSVYNDQTRQAADWMLEEFGDIDQELAGKLQELIKEGEQKQAENLTIVTEAKSTEEAILSAMR
jgi:hypothetical protein